MIHRRQRDISDILLDIVKIVVLTLFTIVCVYPFYYVIIYSISDPSLATQGIYLLPKGFSLNTYAQVLKRGDLPLAFLVSIARTVLGTTICILATSMLAFLMTRKEMPCRKVIYRFVIITMYLDAGIVPWYLVMKMYGMYDNFLLYIIPGAVNAYYMILIKTFMEQLPESLEESAKLEGAGRMDIFFRIVMPLSKPILATVAVYCAVGQWNSWQDNFFLVQNSKLQTVQLILYKYLNSAEALAQSLKDGVVSAEMMQSVAITPKSVQMASIVITVVPIMLVYPFAQKYFTKGIMMGAVKG